jgi:hypothetical protein
MRRRFTGLLSFALLAFLLLQSFPVTNVYAQEVPTHPDVAPAVETPIPPPPDPITVPPIEDPHLPSLSLRLQTEPLWAALGDVITATITVLNSAPDAAEELSVTLPLPTEAQSLTKDAALTDKGWFWSLDTLKPGAQTVVTATMRLNAIPFGEALILQPEALARGLTVPIVATGGSLVTTTPEAKPGAPPELEPSSDELTTSEPTLEGSLPPAEMLPTVPDAQADVATPQAETTATPSQSNTATPNPNVPPTATNLQAPSAPTATPKPAPTDDSSAATDGDGGMRATDQSSWVGKGWTLDTGAVALNKIQLTPYSSVNYYALSFGGRSYTLVRGESLVGSHPDPGNFAHWAWRPTDESFIRIRAVVNPETAYGGPGSPGRGAFDYGGPLTRYIWQIWDKTARATTSVTMSDSSCNGQAGTVDHDIWPGYISWGGDRYRAEFGSVARAIDTQVDWPEYTVGGPLRETRQLQAIKIWSRPNTNWELVRQYTIGLSGGLRSDNRCGNAQCTVWGSNESYPKLALQSIQQVGSDGSSALPASVFGYRNTGGSNYHADGGWNRLDFVNNGQGGTLSASYANVATAVGNGLFVNRHRVTTRTATDGRGNSYPWSYSYGSALMNVLGTALNGVDPSGHGTPTSATLFYNVFADGDSDFDQVNLACDS